MTKVKLSNGTIVNASDVQVVEGVLKITTTDLTVEELGNLFSNKENTSYIVLITEADVECGYKTGFTSFAGIKYDADGVKTVELFQPVDELEARVSEVEGSIAATNEEVTTLGSKVSKTEKSINSANKEISNVSNKVSSVEESVTQANKEIGIVDSKVAEVEAAVDILLGMEVVANEE